MAQMSIPHFNLFYIYLFSQSSYNMLLIKLSCTFHLQEAQIPLHLLNTTASDQ